MRREEALQHPWAAAALNGVMSIPPQCTAGARTLTAPRAVRTSRSA